MSSGAVWMLSPCRTIIENIIQEFKDSFTSLSQWRFSEIQTVHLFIAACMSWVKAIEHFPLAIPPSFCSGLSIKCLLLKYWFWFQYRNFQIGDKDDSRRDGRAEQDSFWSEVRIPCCHRNILPIPYEQLFSVLARVVQYSTKRIDIWYRGSSYCTHSGIQLNIQFIYLTSPVPGWSKVFSTWVGKRQYSELICITTLSHHHKDQYSASKFRKYWISIKLASLFRIIRLAEKYRITKRQSHENIILQKKNFVWIFFIRSYLNTEFISK